jgi:YggT family protein
MGGFAYDLAWLVDAVFGVLTFGLLIYIILGLLVSFAVVNSHNQVVAIVMGTLHRIFEPMLRPIRNFLPSLGGLDISPIFLFITLEFISRILVRFLISLA